MAKNKKTGDKAAKPASPGRAASGAEAKKERAKRPTPKEARITPPPESPKRAARMGGQKPVPEKHEPAAVALVATTTAVPAAADMHFVKLTVAVNTGFLNVEGFIDGDSKAFAIEIQSDSAAQLLSSLSAKIVDALDAHEPSFQILVDRAKHQILPGQ